MFEVEIRVGGALDTSRVTGAMPGFTADPAPPVTMIRGVLAPGEDLSAIMTVLTRHGVVPFDVWVDTFGKGADREESAQDQRRAGGGLGIR